MCANCGCQGNQATMLDLQTGETTTIAGEHDDHSAVEHSHRHAHSHSADNHADHHHHHHVSNRHSSDDHIHSHHSERNAGLSIVDVEARILAKNDALAARNRAWFTGREILALNLRKLRRATRLSQEQLAHDAGIDRTYISSLERCVYAASIDVVDSLARVLGVEAAELLKPPSPTGRVKKKSHRSTDV